MKFILMLSVLAVGLWTMPAFCQSSDDLVELRVAGIYDSSGKPLPSAIEGQSVRLDLTIKSLRTGKMLSPADLVIAHEKLFHLYGFDLGLTNYVHEHPLTSTPNENIWHVNVLFRQAGVYHLWSDITALCTSLGVDPQKCTQNMKMPDSVFPGISWNGFWDNGWGKVAYPYPGQRGHRYLVLRANDGSMAAPKTLNVKSVTTITVTGPTPPNKTPTQLDPKFEGHDDKSIIRLSGVSNIHAKQMVMGMVEFARTDGSKPDITPYLGALAHVVITDLSGLHVMHVHPMVHNGMLMLHMTFPLAGDYRVFAQFVDAKILRTVELALRVQP